MFTESSEESSQLCMKIFELSATERCLDKILQRAVYYFYTTVKRFLQSFLYRALRIYYEELSVVL